MSTTKILRIDRDQPQPNLIAEVAGILHSGGIIAYLTDTLYGLGAAALNDAAVQRVFAVKSRGPEKALPIIIGNRDFLPVIVHEITAEAQRLIDHFWPGPLSLILPASPVVPVALHGNSGKIAVRWPACAVARALAVAGGGALTATSANRSGEAPAQNAAEVFSSLGDAIDLIVDSGPATETRPSTMIDVTIAPPRVLRAGAILTEKIEAVLKISKS